MAPADRAAILLCDQGVEEYSSVYGWDRGGEPIQAVQVSRTIVSQVLRKASRCCATTCRRRRPSPIPKASSHAISASVLAVPLEVFDRVLGVIYLDASDPDARFDEDHLQLLTAIGSIAAAALDNARRME